METQTLRRRIAQIENMNLAELKTKWVELFGTPSPKGMSAKLLRRAGINQVQVVELSSPACFPLDRQLRGKILDYSVSLVRQYFDKHFFKINLSLG